MEGTDENIPATRSVAELIIKIITVHIVTTVNYAYVSKTQRRPLEGSSGVKRVVFFILTPTIVVVELVTNLIETLTRFIKDDAFDESENTWFFFAAILGVHAIQKKSDEENGGKDRPLAIPLLQLRCTQCERERCPIDWTWVARMIVAVFTLVQGIGTTLGWALRLDDLENFGFDDRCGLMGIITIVLSVQTILLLFIRSKWVISQPLQQRTSTVQDRYSKSWVQLACASLIIQDFTRTRNFNERLGHNPTLIFLFCVIRWIDTELTLWPWFVMLLLVIIMRKEILARVTGEPVARSFGPFSNSKRVRFIQMSAVWLVGCTVIADIVIKLVDDIVEVVMNPPGSGKFWMQTPLGEVIPVL